MNFLASLLLPLIGATLALGAATPAPAAPPPQNPLSGLLVLQENHPKVIYFRQAELTFRYPAYAAWEDDFDDAMGFVAQGFPWQKALSRKRALQRNPEYFTRFKQDNPGQVVLIHRDSQENDPRGLAWLPEEDFFPGHWLYFEGCKILSEVPDEDGLTVLRVEDAGRFHLGVGFQKDQEEEIGLFPLDPATGRPDFRRAEYVRLTAVDKDRQTITVIRGQYGTDPLKLAPGQSWAAPIVAGGPWGSRHLVWAYNFSTRCPRDPQGRTCADVLLQFLTRDFGPGGIFATIDGFAEDFAHNSARLGPEVTRGRLPDFDGDGQGDEFLSDTTFATGVIEFYRELRRRVGEHRLITSDAQGVDNQRAFGLLNGIEMERWPEQRADLRKWSCGINTNLFWEANARPPQFNYIKVYGREPAPVKRLKMAAAVCTNVGISVTENAEETRAHGLWDELRNGRENQLGWLGRPAGPLVQLARQQPDLLRAASPQPGLAWTARLQAGPGVRLQADPHGVRATGSPGQDIRLLLPGIPLSGPDLVLFVSARAQPLPQFPAEYARLLVATTGAKGLPLPTNQQHALTEENRHYSFVNGKDFTSSFYFSQLSAGAVDLELAFEGHQEVQITGLQAFAAPDVMVREFQNGLALANPASSPVTFDLAQLFPGKSFRRIRGTEAHDPSTNNGTPVQGSPTLPPQDGLFLVRQK